MREAVIDLGEVPSGEPGDAEPSRPRGSLPYRWVLGPLTVVLTVALGGAAAPPDPPPEPLTLSITLRDSIRVSAGRLHVIGPGEEIAGQSPGRRRLRYPISSYRLPDLAPLNSWTTVVDGDLSFVGDGPGDLLLYSYQGDFDGGLALAAVRPGSAEPVWQRPAYLYTVSADRATALAFQDDPANDYQDDWVGLDTRTGAVRWRIQQPPGSQLTLRDNGDRAVYPSRIYTLGRDGLIEARDTTDGRVAGSVRTTIPVRPDTRFWSAGGLLLVGHPDAGTIAYGEEDLAERWRLDAPGLRETTFSYACGVVICLSGESDDLAAIDPATGRELWHGRPPFPPSLGGLLTFTQPIGDRLLVTRSDSTEPSLVVIDPMTGQVVAEPGAWSSGGPGPEPGTAWVYRVAVPGYQLRYGILDLGTGEVRVRGTADRIAGDCRFESGVLICRRLDSSVGVWQL